MIQIDFVLNSDDDDINMLIRKISNMLRKQGKNIKITRNIRLRNLNVMQEASTKRRSNKRKEGDSVP